MKPEFDADYIIIGSGFGGSVSALRLAEKGYSVLVLEQGKRFRDSDFARTNWDLKRYLWMPLIRCFGIQRMTLFRNVLILSGAGVGGGSLVYANTLLEPGHEFFAAPIWKDLADWRAELAPHYETAKRMLGVTRNPILSFADQVLRDCATELGREETFRPTDVGVFFGKSGETVSDPYFGGAGPPRTGCTACGACMVGCRHGAKNTLEKNYLYFAEKLGARIEAETSVTRIEPLGAASGATADGGEGYLVTVERSTAWWKRPTRRQLRARHLVVSAGVLGTVRLLLRARDLHKTLPRLSSQLGSAVRTNSEALVGVTELNPPPEHDYTRGVAISSVFHPDETTHIEVVRYPSGSGFMRLLAAPMADGAHRILRPLRMLATSLLHPLQTLRLITTQDWAAKSTILLVMQNIDNRMRLRLRRIGTLTTAFDAGHVHIPSYIAVANKVARLFARQVNGIPQSTVNEVVLNIPTTAHILGGCPIGKDILNGVVSSDQKVFGYQNLWVCDGSTIPANLGVNPSLTITAMTERAMSLVPVQKSSRDA